MNNLAADVFSFYAGLAANVFTVVALLVAALRWSSSYLRKSTIALFASTIVGIVVMQIALAVAPRYFSQYTHISDFVWFFGVVFNLVVGIGLTLLARLFVVWLQDKRKTS